MIHVKSDIFSPQEISHNLGLCYFFIKDFKYVSTAKFTNTIAGQIVVVPQGFDHFDLLSLSG